MNIPEKLFPIFKSLYRYNLFQTENYPDILKEKEEEILAKKMKVLQPTDLYQLLCHWEIWKNEYLIETEVSDAKMFQSIELEMKKIN